MKKFFLITGFVPGYPTPELSLEIAQTLLANGADILELSASFSEPIADGPTLQLAHQRVLASGFKKKDAWELYKKIKAPLFLIEYANIIYHQGIANYYKKAVEAGINYLLIPDVPLEESLPFVQAAKKYGIAQIFMIAPTTPDDRMRRIVEAAKESLQNSSNILKTFLYLVSITGVTGSRKEVSGETIEFIKRIRTLTDMPLIVGFGISKKEHVFDLIDAGANGVVTCSAIVDIVHNLHNQKDKMFEALEEYVKNLKN